MKLRTVLSLFDGMSCGRLALDKAGIEYNTYYASEIDKYAIKVAIHNYPDTVELGDINSWKEWSVDWSKVDLILAGSPCQGFSFAGKQLAFDDPRSSLFFVFVDILNHVKTVNPKVKFLLENVVMKKQFQEIITQQVGVEPVLINSALVSAQNRRRLYWANWDFGQPKDKGILLKDIIETEADFNSVILKGRYAEWWEKNKDFQLGKKYSSLDTDKAICMTARQYASWNGNYVSIFQKPRGNNPGGVRAKDGKTPCMSANSWQDNNHLFLAGMASDIIGHDIMRRIYSFDGKSPTLTAICGGNQEKKIAISEKQYRKLTPIECERLQTVLQYKKPVEIVLCSDQAKSFVSAVEKNPKLLKLVSSAENAELKECAKLVSQSMSASQALTKYIAPQSADMQMRKQTGKCTRANQEEQSLIVSNAESTTTCKQVESEVSSAIQSAFITITEGKITHFGKEESHQKDKNYTQVMSGKIVLSPYGNETMQNASDALSVLEMMQTNSHSTSITSFRLSTKNLEQMLAISYWFAKSAIGGFTQDTTQKKTLFLTLIDGYTAQVSNTQRYRMLGNGWTVDVIAHILSSIDAGEQNIKQMRLNYA